MVGLGFGVTQPVEGQVSLVGILELNRELSDEPRLRPERPKRDRNRLGGRGWGNRGQPPEILAERRAGVRAAIRDLMTPAHRLRITGTRDEMIMRCQDGRVVRFLPDGRQHAGIAGSSVRVTRTSEWDGKALVANIELEDSMGFELEEICQVRNGESGRQLIVVSRFRGGPFRNAGENVQRVYNAEEISR
jgi:hypothetical protein